MSPRGREVCRKVTMGKGRAPCCDKSQVKRGPWSPAEDLRLITFIQKHGHDNWRALPKQAGLLRCGKSCRLRWINYLRPDVKRGNFTKEEEEIVIKLHKAWGNKWSKIASHLPGRTDNEIKNVWNTYLKKRLALNAKNAQGDEISSITSSSSSSSSLSSFTSCGKQNIGMEIEPNLLENGNDSTKKDDPRVDTSSCDTSYDSNGSNSSQVDVSIRAEEQMDTEIFKYGGPYDVNNTLHEVNKPESDQILDNMVDIPLEADVDFWNMFDNLDNVVMSNEVVAAAASQSSNFGEENDKEIENKKWLRYLENELGLDDSTGEKNGDREISTKDAAAEPVLVPAAENNFQCETFSKPESDPDMTYFQMWPSWPQNSAI